MPNLGDLQQYTLCDAIQYIKAFEVGHDLSIPKYDLAIRLKTKKDGPVLRNQIKLPYSVKTEIRVCVLVDPNSKAGKQAKEAGAALVGLEDVFEKVKNGKIDFDRCITTPEILPQLNKAGLPRILGPRGLMPSVKLGTVTDNVSASVKNMLGASTYRERQGVIRMAVGRLGFTPEQLRDNVKAFITQVKREGNLMSEAQNFSKEVYEVVCNTTVYTCRSQANNDPGPKLLKLSGLLIERRVQDGKLGPNPTVSYSMMYNMYGNVEFSIAFLTGQTHNALNEMHNHRISSSRAYAYSESLSFPDHTF